jgi:photosystem II stability/assembly factor-like uncharacterized protein
MKKTAIKLILVLLLVVSFQGVNAQPWMENVKTENPTFKEIQNSFYDYWKDRPMEKGKGYKPFKRWEWYWESRLLPNGEFPSPSITWDEFHKYYAQKNLDKQPNTQLSQQSLANWTFSGPSTSAGGYAGLGRTNCIAFHPTDPNTFWVGTPAGGLWKTTNGGTSWTTNTDNLPVLGVSDIAVHPTNPNILYIATGDGDLGSLSALTGGANGDTKSVGVLKSTDGGNTWNTTGMNWSVTSAKLIRRLVMNPVYPQELTAATSDGLWRTLDGGNTWTRVQTGYFMDVEFKPNNFDILYASTIATPSSAAQIFRSINSGATWSLITTLPNVIRINLAVTPASPDLVDAVGVNTASGLAGLWYSSNSGASFSQYFTGTNSNNLLHSSYNASGTGGQGNYDLAYAINPSNADDIWLGGVNTWNSTDGGSNWYLKTMWNSDVSINPNSVPVVHADKHFIAFHPLVPGTMFECNDGGLYKTTDAGATWTDLSNGLEISQIYRIGASATITNDVMCGLQDNGSKELSGGTWNDRIGGDGMECIIDYTNANIQYGSYVNGEIYKTTNGWSTRNIIVQNTGTAGTVNEAGKWVTPYIMHPTNNNTLLVGKSQVYKTTDGGNTWSQLGTISGMTGSIVSMAYAPSNTQTIYVASFNEIYKTTDGGISWSQIGTSTTPITYIAVDPTNSQRLYATKSGYTAGDKVWMSPDGGLNWSNYSGALPNVPINCIVYQNGTNEGLYIGTDVGVFYTDGTMTDWITYQTGLPNVVVTELEISYNNNKLWAGTFGRGLWNTDLFVPLSVSDQEIYNQIIVSPNPNDGLFNITMPFGKSYSLVVYDIQGKKVYEEQSINTEQKNIDLTKNSSGIYLLNFTIDGKSYTKKIVKQ